MALSIASPSRTRPLTFHVVVVLAQPIQNSLHSKLFEHDSNASHWQEFILHNGVILQGCWCEILVPPVTSLGTELRIPVAKTGNRGENAQRGQTHKALIGHDQPRKGQRQGFLDGIIVNGNANVITHVIPQVIHQQVGGLLAFARLLHVAAPNAIEGKSTAHVKGLRQNSHRLGLWGNISFVRGKFDQAKIVSAHAAHDITASKMNHNIVQDNIGKNGLRVVGVLFLLGHHRRQCRRRIQWPRGIVATHQCHGHGAQIPLNVRGHFIDPIAAVVEMARFVLRGRHEGSKVPVHIGRRRVGSGVPHEGIFEAVIFRGTFQFNGHLIPGGGHAHDIKGLDPIALSKPSRGSARSPVKVNRELVIVIIVADAIADFLVGVLQQGACRRCRGAVARVAVAHHLFEVNVIVHDLVHGAKEVTQSRIVALP
mmetsp:Transcript_6936/g.19450  ORF Transcript_6936/g.19450 Transcript_6936/m.19450 type:complete len:425 (+) Transcript_6936:3381-4655(+)